MSKTRRKYTAELYKPSEFFAICNEAFAPLMTRFDLKVAGQYDRKDVWEWVLKNHATGVRVVYELRDNYLGAQICKLEDGQIICSAGEMRADTVLYCFDLADLVVLRAADKGDEILQKLSLMNSRIPELLSRFSQYLYSFGADVLQGDFEVFYSLNTIVKERAREAAFKKWGDKAHDFGW
ncbi:MAG: hypothetical protein K1X50_20020 [Candidatus Promineofilum sp.]|nr:hypothetical protein [Promineifilum sp.]MCW5865013.1 hypothetical protein [Anaerolineae bacterium]